jgi:hypothetical protein
LKQVWFPGVHSNVGGGQDAIELSDITLAWMFSQFQPFVDFDYSYIRETFTLNKKKAQLAKTERPWGCGNIDTLDNNPIYKVSGFRTRTPGQYRKINNVSGEETDDPLENTHERIHPSVRLRLGRAPNTFGINDEGAYLAEALTPQPEHFWTDFLGKEHKTRCGWKLVKNDPKKPVQWDNDFPEETKEAQPQFYWRSEKAGQKPDILVEEPLGFWEKKLLETKTPPVVLDTVPKGWLHGK